MDCATCRSVVCRSNSGLNLAAFSAKTFSPPRAAASRTRCGHSQCAAGAPFARRAVNRPKSSPGVSGSRPFGARNLLRAGIQLVGRVIRVLSEAIARWIMYSQVPALSSSPVDLVASPFQAQVGALPFGPRRSHDDRQFCSAC